MSDYEYQKAYKSAVRRGEKVKSLEAEVERLRDQLAKADAEKDEAEEALLTLADERDAFAGRLAEAGIEIDDEGEGEDEQPAETTVKPQTPREKLIEQWAKDHPAEAENVRDRQEAGRPRLSPEKAAIIEKDRAASLSDGRRGNPNRIA